MFVFSDLSRCPPLSFLLHLIGQTSPIWLCYMAAVTSESMCAAHESTVTEGTVSVCLQCLLSFSCNFNQAVSVTGLAALRRQLRLSFTIIIQVLFPISLPLLRQGQPWLIWAICSADYERRGSMASAPRVLSLFSTLHTHADPSFISSPLLSCSKKKTYSESW